MIVSDSFVMERVDCEAVMQRLISLFREPEDPWPSLAAAREESEEEQKAFGPEEREPLYFADLMAYLRDRNGRAGAAAAAREPRDGAD